MSTEKKLTAVEASRRLGVGLDYLYGLLWTGKIPASKMAGRWFIPASAVEARIKARKKAQGQPEQCP